MPRDSGVDAWSEDASTCVDEYVGERPCEVVWAQGFGEHLGSRRHISEVAVRADDSVAALRGTYLSSTYEMLAYSATGVLRAEYDPSYVVHRLVDAPDGFSFASGYANGVWTTGSDPQQHFAGGAEMGSPQVRRLVRTPNGSIALTENWGGNIRRDSGEVLLPGSRTTLYDGLLAWDEAGNIRWSLLTTWAQILNVERRRGGDGSLLAAVSLPRGVDPACVREGFCLVPTEGALVLLESDGSVRWIRHLPNDAGSSVVLEVERDPSGGIYVLTESALIAFEADGTTRWSTPLPEALWVPHLMWNNGSLVLTFGVPFETVVIGRTRVRDCSAVFVPTRQLIARIDTETGDTLDAWELDDGLWALDLDARSDGSIVLALDLYPDAPRTQTICGSTVEVAGGEEWSALIAVLR